MKDYSKNTTIDNNCRYHNTLYAESVRSACRALYGIVTVLIIMVTSVSAYGLSLLTYTQQSVLANGRWVKISVPQSGVYKITKAQLSQWGFNDLNKVRIYGYGGNRIPEKLVADNYIDDLPIVQSVATSDGVVFYGVGPEKWVQSNALNNGTYFKQENNIYTTVGYYFVTEHSLDIPEVKSQGRKGVNEGYGKFYDRMHYELDAVSPGEAGYILVGENFKVQSDRKFSFDLTDRVEGSTAWFECAFVGKSQVSIDVEFYVNGAKLNKSGTDKINAVSNSGYIHGDYGVTAHTFDASSNKIDLRINMPNVGQTQNVWLDYISLNYERDLKMPAAGYLNFWSNVSALSLASGGKTDITVWDVTNPRAITKLETNDAGDKVCWENDYSGWRTYVAWAPGAAMPAPKYEGVVANQNIHGCENVDMVIFTLPEYKAQAERIAALHRESTNPLAVAVLNLDEVYNEFASGSADVSALRKCLKMFYDRTAQSDTEKLRYALLLGRSTYDNRHLTSQFTGAGAYNTVPCYMGGIAKAQLSDNTAYGTDDFIAMLADGSGSSLGLDQLCVAVGRMPVTSVSEAKSTVDKLYEYVKESVPGNWKNSFLFLADDGDGGVHLKQTEKLIGELQATPDQQSFITKVYVDAYDIVGGVCQGGREEMYRMLDEGVVWWNFCGHANNHSWTGEGMLTYTDIKNMYIKKKPVLMAATCDFLRWDSNTISGGEILFHERNGGVIAAISATRPVYISENGLFTEAIGRAIALRDKNGRLPRLGDIYRVAKNNILNEDGERVSNSNRLRYVLMGDPAMELPMASNIVRLETINGVEVTQENQATLMALQQAELTGSVCNPDGTLIEDFNGVVNINIYDAERSITTKGIRDENIQYTFEQHGGKLFTGTGVVTDGHFSVKVNMPSEVSDNFRPALINMYAVSADKTNEAVGVNKDFYVYGYDETVAPDTEAPVIESMVLNHSSFGEGDVVNDSPMLLAEVKDNVGINLSAAGIGHQMVITLDGKRTFNDVSLFYQPSEDGTPSGTIRYPLKGLAVGDHTLTLKVWDTASNSASRNINFSVAEGVAPTIFEVYTDVNPASTEVKFYVKHNRPDAEMTVTLTVYDMLGHPLWETVSKGPSDMFITAPVTWDLCDSAGRRLPRGIYLYRANISTDNGETYDSAARRLAVTAY